MSRFCTRAAALLLVVLAGLCSAAGSARAGTDMVLDHSFGHRGILSIEGAPVSAAYPRGRLVAARGGRAGVTVERYLSDGSPDRAFGGGDGSVVVSRPNHHLTELYWTTTTIAIGRDDEIVVAGYSLPELGPEAEGGPHPHQAFLARVLAGGKVDWVTEEFDGEPADDGERRLPPAVSGATIEAVEMQGAKILIGGFDGGYSDTDRGFIARIDPGGTPDETFAGGSAATSLPPGTKGKGVSRFSAFSQVHALLSVPGGPVYAAGSIRSGLMLVRLSHDGRLDSRFGRNGIVRTRRGNRHAVTDGTGLARDRAGRLLACGTNPTGALALARYRPDGGLDRRFGENGLVRTRVRKDTTYTSGITVQGDGRIVVAANSLDPRRATGPGGQRPLLTVARYREGGRLDEGFFGDGIFTRPIGFRTNSWQPAVDSLGRLLIIGGPVSLRFAGRT